MKKSLLFMALMVCLVCGCKPNEELTIDEKTDTNTTQTEGKDVEQPRDTFSYCLTDASWSCNWLHDSKSYCINDDDPNHILSEGDTMFLLYNTYDIITFFTDRKVILYHLDIKKEYDKTFTIEKEYEIYAWRADTFPEYKLSFPFIRLPYMWNSDTKEIFYYDDDYDISRYEITSDSTMLYLNYDHYKKMDTIFTPKRKSDKFNIGRSL